MVTERGRCWRRYGVWRGKSTEADRKDGCLKVPVTDFETRERRGARQTLRHTTQLQSRKTINEWMINGMR